MPPDAELPSLAAARIEAIKHIWAIVGAEAAATLRLNRRIELTDDLGVTVLIVTFEEALAAASMGAC